MDSSQLSNLSKSKPLTYTDAYELVSKKILINKMALENLKTQQEYNLLSTKLQKLNYDACTEKIKLVNQLNDILTRQLSEFCEIRQRDCLDIYGYINELDEPSAEFKKLCVELEEKKDKMTDLMEKIQALEATIPAERIVTNYKVKNKNTSDCHSNVEPID